MKLRHPELDRIIDIPDNDEQAEVLAKSGWEPYEPPAPNSPAHVPGHEPPPEPTRRSRQTADQATTQED